MDTIERTIVGLIVLLAVLAAGAYVFTHMPRTAYIPSYNYAASPGYTTYTVQPYIQPAAYRYSSYPTTTSTSSSASNYTTYPLPPQTIYTVMNE